MVDYAPTVMLHIVTLTQVYLPPLDSSILCIVQATVAMVVTSTARGVIYYRNMSIVQAIESYFKGNSDGTMSQGE